MTFGMAIPSSFFCPPVALQSTPAAREALALALHSQAKDAQQDARQRKARGQEDLGALIHGLYSSFFFGHTMYL